MTASLTTQRRLRRLRVRITLLITALAAVIIVIFSVTAIRLDRNLRDEQLDAELLRTVTRVAGLVNFEDAGPDLSLVGPIPDDVVIGIREEFDPLEIVDDADLWDELPEIDEDDLAERAEEIIFGLSDDVIADLTDAGDDSEPLDREVSESLLIENPPDEIVDEAMRGFLIDQAADVGVALEVPTELFISAESLVDDDEAHAAIERVADDEETGAFAAGDLVARGVPLRQIAELRGAVVALADPAVGDAEHADFRQAIILLGLALAVGSAGAAWIVAGRTIQPAARALTHQERFLADAAHELRTPIAAIRATVEAGDEDVDVRLARASTLAADASRLTDDLLTLARMDADRVELERQPLRLDLLVEACVDEDPAFEVIAEESVVDGDARLLERAITNLLNNAREHGGASPDTPARIEVGGGIVTVSDRGPGIPPGLIDSVFDRFRSGSASRGHGLGLPLAKWIATAHRGDLSVASQSGAGATFTLRVGEGRTG